MTRDNNMSWILTELGGLYGQEVLGDLNRITEYYNFYDGPGQHWDVQGNLDYTPTKIRTNLTKKLINEEARFMAGRAPELHVIPKRKEDSDAATEIQQWLQATLNDAGWQGKLLSAVKDCFIGCRVALKLLSPMNGSPGLEFRPSLEFVYDVEQDDVNRLTKVIFFYQANNEPDRVNQRLWRQKFWMEDGRCLLDEAIYNGLGTRIETTKENWNTGLDFIPVYVVINDGLTGDLRGESDVELLKDNQQIYNRLRSDDYDALRFNLFPTRVFVDASPESVQNVIVAPGAIADIQSEVSAHGKQASADILESGFSYDTRIENTLNRIKNDMHDLLCVPNVGLEQPKGMAASGKSMRALYWGLIARCEEKWAAWDGALRWAAEKLIRIARMSGTLLPEIDYEIKIEHLYPITDDEEAERALDMTEVNAQTRSRRSYIAKWQPDVDVEGELKQIARERALLEESFAPSSYGTGGGGPWP